MEITIEQLKKVGFKDESFDHNGMAYRLVLPGNLLELCYYVGDEHMRMQTRGSGFTIPLKGIVNIEGLSDFHFKITGHSWYNPKFKK